MHYLQALDIEPNDDDALCNLALVLQKLTYNDFVYFNEREKLFKVAPVFYPVWLIISVERVRRGRVHQVHRHEAFLPLGGGIRSETEGLHQDDAQGV